ncbi:MAG: LysR family transcriptional regulator, partial [Candidatus Binatia bacterium]
PSVSALVIGLQKGLGVKLFEKLGVKPHLTEAGRRLLQLVDGALGTIDKIQEEMDEVKGLKKGKLSIGSAGIATPIILPTIHKFKSRFPGIEVGLTIQKSENLHHMLADGELDVAIVARPPTSSRIFAEVYRDEEVVFFASTKHPLARRRSVPLKLLATELLIVFKSGLLTSSVERQFAHIGIPFKPLMEISLQQGGREAIISAVESGLGVGYLTKRHLLADIRAGRIKALQTPGFKFKRTIYIAVHKRRYKSHLAQAFIDFLKEHGSAWNRLAK